MIKLCLEFDILASESLGAVFELNLQSLVADGFGECVPRIEVGSAFICRARLTISSEFAGAEAMKWLGRGGWSLGLVKKFERAGGKRR